MNKLRTQFAWLNLLCAMVMAGCSPAQPFFLHEDGDLSHYLDVATDIEYPDLDHETLPDAERTLAPFTTENADIKERRKMSLEEAINIALQNAHVLRTLGGRVFTPVGQTAGSPPESLTLNPDFSPTAYDVAVQESSNTGPEAALANFDAQLESRFTWNRQDRPANLDVSDPASERLFAFMIDGNTIDHQSEVSKRTASGTQWFFRNVTRYDSNNSPTRALYSDWFTSVEMEVRHPLLRNSGVQVNRVPVMLARINTDVAISDFEINVRNFVLEVEQAYWNLYFHFHNLDAARTGFASAHATWKRTKTRSQNELEGGEAANEAQARAQYFAFKSRLQTAKSDLLHQEARLRYLLGITATDGRLIQPSDQPTKARVEFDWYDVKNEALVRSPELRRQKWRIKQQQLQLIAARNQLLPQFDAIALYRFLGFGDQLSRLGTRSGADFPNVNSYATDNLFENNYGEWQLGFQYQMPIGYRAEMAQVKNQQLQLRRAEKRLQDQELELTHQLSAAMRRLRDQYRIAQTLFNTLVAYRDQVAAAETAYKKAQSIRLDVVLDAQSRLAQSEVDYFRALTEYNLAIAEVHLRKGSLLEYNGVALSEGPWPSKAYFDAHTRARQRDASYYLDYGFTRPAVVSQGSVAPYATSPPLPSMGDVSPPSPAGLGGEVMDDIFMDTSPTLQPVIQPKASVPAAEDSIYGSLGL